MLQKLGISLSKFAQATTEGNVKLNTEFSKVAANILEIEEQARKVINQYPESLKQAALENLNILLNSKGSLSIPEHIEKKIVTTLTGEKYTGKLHLYPELQIANLEDPLKNLKLELSSLVKEVRKALDQTRQQLKKQKNTKIKVRTKKGQFTSLTSIQNLINSKLAEQIKRNMGDGSSKSVLNYRTGRFASSAQVERLTMSKEGMITAFYSYMKSPYQTFERGFKQGSPVSRDPKLLIGKSIREIAAASMANRLRAVSI